MEKRKLDKEFKDSEKPLRVVFVCAMWLTGFDVRCLSCLYLDNLIRDTLWAELPESYDEVSISVFRQKIYEYLYTRYSGIA